MIFSYRDKTPRIGKNVFIAPTAVIIGDVDIADGASIWYGTIIRGDMEPITIGAGTNIQDNSVVHTDWGFPALIGEEVTVGHGAVIHGCTIERDCLIGIGAIVLSGARLHASSVVAAASVVAEGHEVGPNQLVMGTPAKVKKVLAEADMVRFRDPVQNYKGLSVHHRQRLRQLVPALKT